MSRHDALTRRHFLAAAAATGLAPVAFAQPADPELPPAPHAVPDDEKVGFAIVGLGNFSMNHMLPSFAATRFCKPTAFVTGSPDKARELAPQYGIRPDHIVGYDAFDRLADFDDVQVAYVATPNGLHARHTLAAIRDGNTHVLVEKPMATDEAECREMIEAADDAGRKLMVAYRVRYEPFNNRIIEITRSRELGAVRQITGDVCHRMNRGGTWRSNPALNGRGGPLMDLGVYIVQALRYASGEEPTHVHGYTWFPDDDDRFNDGTEATCVWQFRFPSGATGNGSTGWDHAFTNRYRVIYDNGWAELDPATGYTGQRLRVMRDRQTSEVTDLRHVNQFAAQLDHMADCVRRDQTPHTDGHEGLRDVRLMRAIYRSAETGRTIDVDAAD